MSEEVTIGVSDSTLAYPPPPRLRTGHLIHPNPLIPYMAAREHTFIPRISPSLFRRAVGAGAMDTPAGLVTAGRAGGTSGQDVVLLCRTISRGSITTRSPSWLIEPDSKRDTSRRMDSVDRDT